MGEVAVPTRDEIVALLQAVLDGTTSRTAAAEWASEVQEEIEELDTDAIDPEMWHLLRLAASLDVKSGEAYLHDEAAIRDHLAASGARAVTVPYRANRAVLFDSDLFHATDSVRFSPGYENRRINVTLLYGQRAARRR